jgi:Helix-turn-helix domain
VRRVNGRRIKLHRSYTIDEAARCLRVHKNTVRRWLASGLAMIDGRRPILIHGVVLRTFLAAERNSRRQRCGPGELFCLRCRAPRAAAAQMLDYLPITNGSGNLRGICNTCSSLIHRRVALGKISEVAGNCDVAFPQGYERLGDSHVPSLNGDFRDQALEDEQR